MGSPPPGSGTAAPSARAARVFVGPAGWSYDDWQGIVYPSGSPARRLEHVARMFGVIEINSTFYGPPSPATTAAWARQVASLPGFRFTAKLHRLFTHESQKAWTLEGRDDFRDGLEPLREAGLLGALLVQFAWFYQATDANLHRLQRIARAFPEHRLVLEIRHRSWLEGGWLDRVSALGYSFCNADQPMASTTCPLDAVVTGPQGYLRLHGRNAEKWFDRSATVAQKYDYYYGREQLPELLRVAEALRGMTEELYVIANNHFAGKGPANALEMQAALTGRTPPVPESLKQAFPALRSLADVASHSRAGE